MHCSKFWASLTMLNSRIITNQKTRQKNDHFEKNQYFKIFVNLNWINYSEYKKHFISRLFVEGFTKLEKFQPINWQFSTILMWTHILRYLWNWISKTSEIVLNIYTFSTDLKIYVHLRNFKSFHFEHFRYFVKLCFNCVSQKGFNYEKNQLCFNVKFQSLSIMKSNPD